METYSQQIELINKYLNNLMSDVIKTDFESKLESDADFNMLYKEHIVFLSGLHRIQIKEDIQKAKRAFQTEKWIKISGVSIIVLGILVLLYSILFKAEKVQINPPL